MKIVVLTTQTLHHAYFLRELTRKYPLELVLTETKPVLPQFETYHPFEDERDAYEMRELFNGENPPLKEFAETREYSTINDSAAVSLLTDIKPDVIVVFGTGKLSEQVIATCQERIVNLHGGDPERYRGLDSHLWAIYHNDFDSLVTTLHRLNAKLDDGEIILQAPVELFSKMPMYTFRRYNTDICVKMTVSALGIYDLFGSFIFKKQRQKGRYYSFMPATLKEICLKNFENYTKTL